MEHMQMRRHALLMLLRIRILEKGSHLQPIRDHLRLWIPGPPLPLLALREHRWGESRAMCSGQPETKTTKTTKTGPELVPMTPGIGEVITMLRSAEARLHFGAPLGVLGLVLMLAGGVWALTRFLVNNSFIFLLLAGLMCVLVSLAADPRGLLRYVPEEMQDFLFNKRVFDILYDVLWVLLGSFSFNLHLLRWLVASLSQIFTPCPDSEEEQQWDSSFMPHSMQHPRHSPF